ncbi:MAG: hypothetical protein M1816_001363 [Peltula sp. TS41687]|nr:MAG: hypothetical protein M1816_001363 [Peltula sp. TS41687]
MPLKSKRRVSPADSDEDDTKRKQTKKTKVDKSKSARSSSAAAAVPGGGALDDHGAEYWELSNHRRVGVDKFKGKYMINIREYYEKDGQMLPGKKGISLPIDQYAALIAVLPHMETVLKEKGEEVPRPVYGEDDGKDDGKASTKARKRKRNIEATSEEEGDDDGDDDE